MGELDAPFQPDHQGKEQIRCGLGFPSRLTRWTRYAYPPAAFSEELPGKSRGTLPPRPRAGAPRRPHGVERIGFAGPVEEQVHQRAAGHQVSTPSASICATPPPARARSGSAYRRRSMSAGRAWPTCRDLLAAMKLPGIGLCRAGGSMNWMQLCSVQARQGLGTAVAFDVGRRGRRPARASPANRRERTCRTRRLRAKRTATSTPSATRSPTSGSCSAGQVQFGG